MYTISNSHMLQVTLFIRCSIKLGNVCTMRIPTAGVGYLFSAEGHFHICNMVHGPHKINNLKIIYCFSTLLTDL